MQQLFQTKVRKGAKIRSRYNQVPHPTQDTNGKVTNSQLDTTNESQEVSPFPAGDHKAQINRRAQRHSKHKTEQKHKRSIIASSLTYFLCQSKPKGGLIPECTKYYKFRKFHESYKFARLHKMVKLLRRLLI